MLPGQTHLWIVPTLKPCEPIYPTGLNDPVSLILLSDNSDSRSNDVEGKNEGILKKNIDIYSEGN
jgi:hypothetical protein